MEWFLHCHPRITRCGHKLAMAWPLITFFYKKKILDRTDLSEVREYHAGHLYSYE
jgi:hypothetical protein